ncbi:MAG TPA: cyclic nucleotide-binding domain-containing protein [Spirochaetota bacterium]|nr:cyclic nucleotide-binding domain-containing protein [Spirochaetota bacterium]
MEYEKIILSFIPVIIFLLIYKRYFLSRGSVTKYITSLLTGICYALFLLLSGGLVADLMYIMNPLVRGFIMAGLLEKAGAVIAIYVLLKKFPGFTISEGIITAMFFGLGFSCIENFFYALEMNSSIIVIRMIFSVPLHITTCGIAGFYLGISKLSWSPAKIFRFRLKSILIPLLFHGMFDAALMKGEVYSYIAAPILIISVVYLEIILARSQSFFSEKKLKVMGINFEEWRIKDRQPRYDRWVKRYTGILKSSPAPFFNWNPGIIKFTLVVVMITLAGTGMALYRELSGSYSLILAKEEAIAVFVLFPLCVALVLIITGAVNPMFFVKSMLSLPIISDVEIIKNGTVEEYLGTNDISTGNCFLQTTEPLGLGKVINLRFKLGELQSVIMTGRVMWENHIIRHDAFGSIVRFDSVNAGFYIYYLKYFLLRYWKGAVFLLRLPGFDAIKGFFYKPLVMTDDEDFFPAGSIVFREGDTGDKFYLIKKGRIIFFKNMGGENIITVNTAVAGEFFGELAALGDHKNRNATAICADDTILAVASKDNLDILIANNPDFAMDLIETLTNRVVLSEKVFFESMKEIEQIKHERENLAHAAVMLVMIGLGFDPGRRGLDMDVDAKKIMKLVKTMDDITAAQLSSLFIKRQTILTGGGDPRHDEDFLASINAIFANINDEDELD